MEQNVIIQQINELRRNPASFVDKNLNLIKNEATQQQLVTAQSAPELEQLTFVNFAANLFLSSLFETDFSIDLVKKIAEQETFECKRQEDLKKQQEEQVKDEIKVQVTQQQKKVKKERVGKKQDTLSEEVVQSTREELIQSERSNALQEINLLKEKYQEEIELLAQTDIELLRSKLQDKNLFELLNTIGYASGIQTYIVHQFKSQFTLSDIIDQQIDILLNPQFKVIGISKQQRLMTEEGVSLQLFLLAENFSTSPPALEQIEATSQEKLQEQFAESVEFKEDITRLLGRSKARTPKKYFKPTCSIQNYSMDSVRHLFFVADMNYDGKISKDELKEFIIQKKIGIED